MICRIEQGKVFNRLVKEWLDRVELRDLREDARRIKT